MSIAAAAWAADSGGVRIEALSELERPSPRKSKWPARRASTRINLRSGLRRRRRFARQGRRARPNGRLSEARRTVQRGRERAFRPFLRRPLDNGDLRRIRFVQRGEHVCCVRHHDVQAGRAVTVGATGRTAVRIIAAVGLVVLRRLAQDKHIRSHVFQAGDLPNHQERDDPTNLPQGPPESPARVFADSQSALHSRRKHTRQASTPATGEPLPRAHHLRSRARRLTLGFGGRVVFAGSMRPRRRRTHSATPTRPVTAMIPAPTVNPRLSQPCWRLALAVASDPYRAV